MEPKELSCWERFEPEIAELEEAVKNQAAPLRPSEFLFRGQCDSRFQLTTTLERAGCEGMAFDDYYRLVVNKIKPAVESFTGKRWDDLATWDLGTVASFRDPGLLTQPTFPEPSFYRYLVYLRHYGLPSPLLDWSHSMFVAAFFAFNRPCQSEKRSIYVYCEMPRAGKGGAVGEPWVRQCGRYVRGDPRHFRQQSDYTVCGRLDQTSGCWRFQPHEKVIGGRPGQDYLWKFNLPSTERVKVLKLLDQYNLNAFSLFDSQESLLETMWFRERVR